MRNQSQMISEKSGMLLLHDKVLLRAYPKISSKTVSLFGSIILNASIAASKGIEASTVYL
jgi:hypothetical protein